MIVQSNLKTFISYVFIREPRLHRLRKMKLPETVPWWLEHLFSCSFNELVCGNKVGESSLDYRVNGQDTELTKILINFMPIKLIASHEMLEKSKTSSRIIICIHLWNGGRLYGFHINYTSTCLNVKLWPSQLFLKIAAKLHAIPMKNMLKKNRQIKLIGLSENFIFPTFACIVI